MACNSGTENFQMKGWSWMAAVQKATNLCQMQGTRRVSWKIICHAWQERKVLSSKDFVMIQQSVQRKLSEFLNRQLIPWKNKTCIRKKMVVVTRVWARGRGKRNRKLLNGYKVLVIQDELSSGSCVPPVVKNSVPYT